MGVNSLQFQHLEQKIRVLEPLKQVAVPPTGWVKALRTALGMTLQQLAHKLSMSKQAVQALEKRESQGAVTLKTLQEVARAMDMQLVYGFVPNDGSLEALIEKRAIELAAKIVGRTDRTMQLEEQANSPERLASAIRERAEAIKKEKPSALWD
jgi:predicted DNA-binding mobile mystery protein A